MEQLIYASTMSSKYNPVMMQIILNTAYNTNRKFNITGFLISDKNFFLQCIEGEKEHIDQLYTNIKKDYRHNDIKLLGVTNTTQRDFGEWNMGYINDSTIIKEVISKEIQNTEFIPHQFTYEQALRVLKKLSYLV